ncbi:MAG TPA: alpha/beta fold hydrolase [Candidatus Angelobacter sp.]|nr:alpha/beta fold hydrolase [Candidatus Angelobacter sp.]
MKKLLNGTLCLLLLVTAAAAQPKQSASSGVPPLIDREILFGNPEIAGAQISPNGQYLAFVKPWKDTRNVYVKGVNEPFSAARLLTSETKRPVAGYFWSRDSKYVLFVKDKDGDENFNVYAVDPGAKPAPGADAPEARDLTGLKGVQVHIYSLPKNDPDAVYIGLNDRDKAWHDLYRLRLSTGEKTLLRKNTDRIAGWEFDLSGQLRLATRSAENGDTEILRVDADQLTKIYSCNVFENCGVARFQKDGKKAYIETNKGADINLTSLALLDPATGKTELVESDPLNKVDFGGAVFSEVTDQLVITSYEDDRERRYFKDKAFESDYKWLQSQLPGKEIAAVSRTLDEQVWLVTAHSDTEPGETYLFDRKTHKLTLQFKIRERLPRESLAAMKAVHYKSSDGLEIPAYLTLPKGVPAKNLPAIIIPHGGPWARDSWGYNPLAQFFANRGYAVLMPNFRGSTGYGKKFLDAGNLEWGRKMQDDVTWGEKYLVAEGIADPKHIGIMGGSYGGYATLAGVAFTPDVYAAAVDIVGPSNLITLLESIPPYWEAARKVFEERMGNPNTPEGKKLLNERSPLNSADKIKTPLLVVQGANDPRVNKREADQIVIALRDRGFPVEYIVAPDEGHGFARPVNNMALYMQAEKFLAKYLGGRYQDGGTPETVARLKEISVDPKTVVLAKKVDANAVGTPKPVADLQSSSSKYQVKISVNGQEIPLSLSTTIKEDNGAWMATDILDTPNGQVVDTAVIEKGSLIVRKQSVKQGPVSVNLDFAGDKASGSMSMNGQDRPISVDLGGPLFADAAGSPQVIACLPLAEGYTATYRNFDVQQQKVKLMQLKVAGVESVTVPAGTFNAFRVEISSADGGNDKETVWIAKDSRKPVKSSAVLAQMGGAVLTSELLQ